MAELHTVPVLSLSRTPPLFGRSHHVWLPATARKASATISAEKGTSFLTYKGSVFLERFDCCRSIALACCWLEEVQGVGQLRFCNQLSFQLSDSHQGTKLLPYELMVQCKFCRVGLRYECWYTTHAFCSGYLLSEGLRNEDCPCEVESCLTTPRPHSNESSESDDSVESESHRAMRITNLLETVHTNGLIQHEC